MLANCGDQAPTSKPQPIVPAAAPARADSAAIGRAKAALSTEKKIRSVSFAENDYRAEWLIGVDDDGSKRWGYAEYVCLQLGDLDVRDERTEVWIVDEKRRRKAGGVDVPATAGLGGVKCATGARLTA